MKGMIFAAGLGTRLNPITEKIPKALVKINNKTLLQIVIEKFLSSGIDEIVINVHHFADQIKDYLKFHNYFGTEIIISDESDQLLETGGGLKKASHYFSANEPFVLHNVDIISNINLSKMFGMFNDGNSSALLAVQNRKSSRKLLFNNENILCGWKNINTGEVILSREEKNLTELSFSGIQIIHPKLFEYFPKKKVFSIIELYLEAAKHTRIVTYQHDNDFVCDVGKIEDLKNLSY